MSRRCEPFEWATKRSTLPTAVPGGAVHGSSAANASSLPSGENVGLLTFTSHGSATICRTLPRAGETVQRSPAPSMTREGC